MAIDWKAETFETLPSTMDVARERGEAGASEGTVIVAKEQTSGIGRRGNTWIGLSGNLYFSAIIKSIQLKYIGQYSFIAAVALADTVKSRLKSDFTYTHKWPNDGLINGLKFAGILLQTGKVVQTGEDFLNMGVGINVNSAPDDKIAFNNVADMALTAPEFLEVYLEKLAEAIKLYRTEGFVPLRLKWLENAQGLNGPMEARLPNETLRGIFEGLDETGALLLRLDNGSQRVIHSGEVFFGNNL